MVFKNLKERKNTWVHTCDSGIPLKMPWWFWFWQVCHRQSHCYLPTVKIRNSSSPSQKSWPFLLFLKHGQSYFSKVTDCISDYQTPILPEKFWILLILSWWRRKSIGPKGFQLVQYIMCVNTLQVTSPHGLKIWKEVCSAHSALCMNYFIEILARLVNLIH